MESLLDSGEALRRVGGAGAFPDQERSGMGYCIAFDMEETEQAWEHMELECVISYGEEANGHCLYTWDEGGRALFRCKRCGGYVLCQRSEYHNFLGEDEDYQDYFPVDSPEEAQELNQSFGGAEIEMHFPGRYLRVTNGKRSWSKDTKK